MYFFSIYVKLLYIFRTVKKISECSCMFINIALCECGVPTLLPFTCDKL